MKTLKQKIKETLYRAIEEQSSYISGNGDFDEVCINGHIDLNKLADSVLSIHEFQEF